MTLPIFLFKSPGVRGAAPLSAKPVVSHRHLQAYLNEFVFRFNRRFYPMTAFNSALGLAAHASAPTYKKFYSGDWTHRAYVIGREPDRQENNKAKVAIRKSYGFKTADMLKISLYHKLSKLPIPECAHEYF